MIDTDVYKQCLSMNCGDIHNYIDITITPIIINMFI